MACTNLIAELFHASTDDRNRRLPERPSAEPKRPINKREV